LYVILDYWKKGTFVDEERIFSICFCLDRVLYSKYAGTDIKLGTDEYVLLSEKDILAIVN